MLALTASILISLGGFVSNDLGPVSIETHDVFVGNDLTFEKIECSGRSDECLAAVTCEELEWETDACVALAAQGE